MRSTAKGSLGLGGFIGSQSLQALPFVNGGNGHLSRQQQTGRLLAIAPGEATESTAPGRPGVHAQALQLSWIRAGRDRDAGGHGVCVGTKAMVGRRRW